VNHNWTWIQLHWRSHSGKTIHPSSEDFDCSDIDFWLEPLDIELWYKQMYPPLKNPFLTKNLNYTLTVKSLQVDITATIHCTITSVDELTILANQLSDILGQLNDASEKNNRKSGVFHNWSYEVTNTSTVTFFIDMGSAGVKQVNKWLQKINAFSAISTVIIS
jgi:hypothetical protein